MTTMDLAGYDTEAINRAEARIREFGPKSRREAAAFHMKVLAQLIADDALIGVEQWPPRLAEYRYLRDLTAHLYSQAEDTLARIDAPDNSCQVCGSLPVVIHDGPVTRYGPACGHGSWPAQAEAAVAAIDGTGTGWPVK